VSRNEDDRKRDLSTSEFADKFYAICPGHPNISYDATGTQLINRLKKAVRRVVGLDGESEHAEHLAKGVADRLLIVYDKDGRTRHVTLLAIDRAAAKIGIRSRPPPGSGARGARHAIRQSTRRSAAQGRDQPLSMWREARIADRPVHGRPRDHCPRHQSRHVGGASNRYAAILIRASALPAPAIDSIAFRTRLSTTCSNCVRSPWRGG